jgi:hypothetical protein
MQTHKVWAWGLLLMVLGLDGVAYWAMVWRKDVPISLCCLLLGGRIAARKLSPVA